VPDARKGLEQLEEEWQDCEKCELGQRRKAVGGKFVFGEGSRRGIMFIGEGPGVNEEAEGRPFVGRSGQLLRRAIEKLGLTNYYITNCVSCRSCSPAYDSMGKPVLKRDGDPLIKDETPTPPQIQTCLPRLYEQIYLVDPILIVALGGEAAATLRGKPVKITVEHGNTETIYVPGAWKIPVLTEKKQAWYRKVRGELVAPTEQHQVAYLMLPTMHPAYVLRFVGDKRMGNPLEAFVGDMRKAANIYLRYLKEVYGEAYVARELTTESIYEDEED